MLKELNEINTQQQDNTVLNNSNNEVVSEAESKEKENKNSPANSEDNLLAELHEIKANAESQDKGNESKEENVQSEVTSPVAPHNPSSEVNELIIDDVIKGNESQDLKETDSSKQQWIYRLSVW